MLNLPQLPLDKANHFVYGVAVALAAGVVAHVAPAVGALLFHMTPAQVGAVAAAAAGIGKEVHDHFFQGDVDPLDAVATAAGGLVVLAGAAL